MAKGKHQKGSTLMVNIKKEFAVIYFPPANMSWKLQIGHVQKVQLQLRASIPFLDPTGCKLVPQGGKLQTWWVYNFSQWFMVDTPIINYGLW